MRFNNLNLIRAIAMRSIIFLLLILIPVSCKKLEDIGIVIKELSIQAAQAIDAASKRIADELSGISTTLYDLKEDISPTLVDTHHRLDWLIGQMAKQLASDVLCVRESTTQSALFFLDDLKASLLGSDRPTLQPTLCVTHPRTIDLNKPAETRQVVEYVGFDLPMDIKTISALLVGSDTMSLPIWDSDEFNFLVVLPSHLTKYEHLCLIYDEEILSSVPIIQKQETAPKIRQVWTEVTTITNRPPHQGGDEDCKGIIQVRSHVEFRVLAHEIQARLYVESKEPRPDWSRWAGWGPWVQIMRIPEGWKAKLLSPLSLRDILLRNNQHYVDTDLEPFETTTKAGNVIVWGDRRGRETNYTGVKLFLKNFPVELKEIK